MKPLFLDNPPAYTRIQSSLSDPIRYASAIEHKGEKMRDFIRDALLAAAIGVGLALVLVAWWSS